MRHAAASWGVRRTGNVSKSWGVRRTGGTCGWAVLCAAAALLCAPVRPLQADQAAPVAAPAATSIATAQDLQDAIDAIDRLRVINPLELTAGQLTQLIDTVTSMQTDYNAKLKDLRETPILAMSLQIREMKRAVLQGKPIPTEFDDAIKKMEKEYMAAADKLDLNTLTLLCARVKAILTADQFADAAQISKEAMPRDSSGKVQKGSDTQWFNLYVMKTFIQYPAILPLLKEKRAALMPAGG